MLRLVLDTSVVVAALDSPTGASRALLMAALQGRCHLLLSTGLILEYEAVLTRSSMLEMIGIGADEVGRLLDRLAGQCVPVHVDWQWRPVACDPDDDVVVATAINGQANAIATFNVRDMRAGAARFGIAVERPAVVLRRVRQ